MMTRPREWLECPHFRLSVVVLYKWLERTCSAEYILMYEKL